MRSRLTWLFALMMAGCGGELGSGGLLPGEDGDSSELTTESDELGDGVAEATAELASVGGKARVTATALNLRTGPGTSNAIILTMPNGAIVDVLAVSGGWYKVTYNGKTGWATGTYLTPVTSSPPPTGSSKIDQAIARAKSGVGFSYHWGAGCWSPGGAKGACYGSCPNCTHSGTWGADCSGFVAKVWQVPGASAISSCQHPYSTYNFRYQKPYWSQVSRGSVKRGDALVHNSNGAGHMFIYESGDGWGWMKAYEARGCSAGITYNSRTASSSYVAIRRTGY
jgi:cell wall-associated NlpC family hydrolase